MELKFVAIISDNNVTAVNSNPIKESESHEPHTKSNVFQNLLNVNNISQSPRNIFA